ncbi:MAG: hypothetical protein MUF19_01605 [Candidatus Pacebacteria bacterium]|nr:hypothetical protein [Candidatus Paceibacterota bacterium]
MNKHIIFGIVGILIAAVLIVVGMGLNRAEAPLLGDGAVVAPDPMEVATSTESEEVVSPRETPAPAPAPKPVVTKPEPSRGCMVTGCSSQLCVEEGQDMATTCEWVSKYSCYQTATCERQATGECGWTDTPALQQCLVAAEGEMQIELQN